MTYLQGQHQYHIVGSVDLNQLVSQPRNTLYKLFKQWHKTVYNNNERIVLYTRTKIPFEVLCHIQQCASVVDISNFFILICGPDISVEDFELVKHQHSSDDCIFDFCEINFFETVDQPDPNPFLTLPETFCFSPWAHLEISSQGELRPCCVYKQAVTDDRGIPYNINTHSLEEVYNSNYMKQLRTEFLQGAMPSGCSNCWYKEKHRGQSNRIWFKKHLGIEADYLDVEQNSLTNLKSLDIKLGNLCNFTCRICNPFNSSRIAKEQVEHFGSTINLKLLNQLGRWSENEKIWTMLENVGHQLINIDFYGGEPFLIKQHENFLDYLISNNFSQNIRLHYNSNGSIYPDHLFHKWNQFRHVDIAFSIDNTESRFELERGGSWTEVEQNIDKFLKFKLENMSISVFTTISVQNVYYLEHIIRWVQSRKFDALNWNLLETPKFLSVYAMTQELTEVIISRLNQIDSTTLEKYNVLSIIEQLKRNNTSSNSIDELANYMLKLDSIRNQKFNETHPEIAKIIYKGN